MMRNIGAILTVATLLWAAPVLADGPLPFAEFTFKRVKPPVAGTTKRITVFIEPSAIRVTAPAAPTLDPVEPAIAGDLDWFWNRV